jgi:hypothetical protein
MDTYQATNKLAAAMPTANVNETTTPRKRAFDLDALPPAREDGPRPIPRRFVGRNYEFGSGKTVAQYAEDYGTATIHVTRDIIGLAGEHWKAGDEISNVPVNFAVTLVGDKVAQFDKSEFKGDGEIEALEARGYIIQPPNIRAKDRPEFASVVARKTGKWMAGCIESRPATA